MKTKFHSLGAAAVGDEDEDIDEESLELEDEDEEEESDGDEEEADGEGQDEGGEDEDGEEETSDEEDDEETDEGRDVLTRGERRFQTLSKRAKDAEAAKLASEKKLSDLQKQIQDIKNAGLQQNQAQYRAFLDSLPPEERMLREAQDARNQATFQIQQLEFKMQDSADKTAYEAKAAVNKHYARFADQVESILQEAQTKQNMWFPREEILANIIGKMVLKNKLKPVSKKAAKVAVKKHTVKSSSSRSDVHTSSRGMKNSKADRNRRLSEASF